MKHERGKIIHVIQSLDEDFNKMQSEVIQAKIDSDNFYRKNKGCEPYVFSTKRNWEEVEKGLEDMYDKLNQNEVTEV